MANVEYWEKRVRLCADKTIATGRALREAENQARGSSPSSQRAKDQLTELKRAHHRSLSELDAAESQLKKAKAANDQ